MAKAEASADLKLDAKVEHRPFGLALSGGGFRATLFHLGVLLHLIKNNGVNHRSLENSTIVGVSGGAILAAHLASRWSLYTAACNRHYAQSKNSNERGLSFGED